MILSQFLFENRIDFLIAQYGDKLIARYKQDVNKQANAVDITNLLATVDPSSNKQYLQWIIKQYLAKQFRAEDVSRIRGELDEFERVKSKLDNKDINSYKTLPELYDALKPFQKQEVVSNNEAERQLKAEMYKQAEVLHKGNDWMLITPHTKEASCYFGRGTKWCTAASKNTAFDEYNDKSPLYILIDNAGNKYQIHFGVTTDEVQIMDARDQEVQLHPLLQKYNGLLQVLLDKTELKHWADPTNAYAAYWYARNVIGGRWPEAEPYIMKNPTNAYAAYWYAYNIINGRWPEAEPYIMKDPSYAFQYAKNIIKGRWPEAEPYIAKSPFYAVRYARDIIKGRWPEAEPYIMKAPKSAFEYATEIINGRWPEAEPYIMKDPYFAYYYATEIINGSWPEAEPYIMKGDFADRYSIRFMKNESTTYPAQENEFAKSASEMKIPNVLDNKDYGKKTKAVARKVMIRSTSDKSKLYGARAIFTKESFCNFLISEASDYTSLPERVINELKKLIRSGANDLVQKWKNALELVNKAYEVSSVRLPTPEEAGAWSQYESLIQFGVKSLATARGMNGDWRMTDVMFQESMTNLPAKKQTKLNNRRFFVDIPGEKHSVEVDCDTMDDIIEKMTNKMRKEGAKVRVEERSAKMCKLSIWVDGNKREEIHIKEIS